MIGAKWKSGQYIVYTGKLIKSIVLLNVVQPVWINTEIKWETYIQIQKKCIVSYLTNACTWELKTKWLQHCIIAADRFVSVVQLLTKYKAGWTPAVPYIITIKCQIITKQITSKLHVSTKINLEPPP